MENILKMKVYKIRNKETGLFSKGGTGRDVWTKTGKSWSNIGHVKLHLNMHNKNKRNYPYANAEVVEVEINYDQCYSYPVDDLMDEIQENRDKRNREAKERRERWARERELKKLKELKEKYE